MAQAIHSPIHSDSLADVLERVLDKGVVIAGDVVVSLVGIELLSIKLRLLITTVDKAQEMGINWWEMDPSLSSKARAAELEAQATPPPPAALETTRPRRWSGSSAALAEAQTENEALKAVNAALLARLERLESKVDFADDADAAEAPKPARRRRYRRRTET